MDKYVLIMAGGDGKRIDAGLPKQFIELNSFPLLMHTINAFGFFEPEIIVVLAEKDMSRWHELCEKFDFRVDHTIQPAGPKRFHSVKSGLKKVPDKVLVAIHDGVRPLVSKETILRTFEMAELKGNAVPAIPVNESIREIDAFHSKPVDRSKLRRIQTPQVFHSNLIKKAYNQSYDESFTDDATVLETTGEAIHLVEGNPENIKVTGPTDLLVAKALGLRPKL